MVDLLGNGTTVVLRCSVLMKQVYRGPPTVSVRDPRACVRSNMCTRVEHMFEPCKRPPQSPRVAPEPGSAVHGGRLATACRAARQGSEDQGADERVVPRQGLPVEVERPRPHRDRAEPRDE